MLVEHYVAIQYAKYNYTMISKIRQISILLLIINFSSYRWSKLNTRISNPNTSYCTVFYAVYRGVYTLQTFIQLPHNGCSKLSYLYRRQINQARYPTAFTYKFDTWRSREEPYNFTHRYDVRVTRSRSIKTKQQSAWKIEQGKMKNGLHNEDSLERINIFRSR